MEHEMNIDPHRIRQLREARAWSQEHLAEVSGLSTRTIQRLETSGAASVDSRQALASAFGVAPGELLPISAPAAPDAPPPARRSLAREGVIYLCVCGALLTFDLVRHQGITWSKWPLLGWGSALAIRFLLRRLPRPAGNP